MYEVKLFKSKWKAVKYLLLVLMFIAPALTDIFHYSNIFVPWIDWFWLFFWGLGIPFCLYIFFDNRPELILNLDGIFERASYSILDKREGRGFVRWDDIEDIHLIVVREHSRSGIPTYKSKFINISLKGYKDNLKKDDAHKRLEYGSKSPLIFSFPLMNLKKFDEQKLVELIKLIISANVSERQRLLSNYKL